MKTYLFIGSLVCALGLQGCIYHTHHNDDDEAGYHIDIDKARGTDDVKIYRITSKQASKKATGSYRPQDHDASSISEDTADIIDIRIRVSKEKNTIQITTPPEKKSTQ